MNSESDEPVRVLVCDDDVNLSGALAQLIHYSTGLELVAPPVQTGQDAVDSTALHHPDVVLMDVELIGVMNGYEATVLIRKAWPSTNVVIMSAMANLEEAQSHALDAGAFGFLPKSDSSTKIVETLRAAGHANRPTALR